MTVEELNQAVEALRAENALLKHKAANPAVNGLRVSPKGALSVYGLGRFPVTLYKSQWNKLLGMAQQIQAFIDAHDAELKTKE